MVHNIEHNITIDDNQAYRVTQGPAESSPPGEVSSIQEASSDATKAPPVAELPDFQPPPRASLVERPLIAKT